jgi:hypothetical protein
MCTAVGEITQLYLLASLFLEQTTKITSFDIIFNRTPLYYIKQCFRFVIIATVGI